MKKVGVFGQRETCEARYAALVLVVVGVVVAEEPNSVTTRLVIRRRSASAALRKSGLECMMRDIFCGVAGSQRVGRGWCGGGALTCIR